LPSNAELQTITTDEQVTTDDHATDSTRRWRCCWVTPRATAAATCYGSSCYCCLQPNMGTTIKHPVPDRVKQSFAIFDIRTLWRSGLSVRVPGCQKLQTTA